MLGGPFLGSSGAGLGALGFGKHFFLGRVLGTSGLGL